MRDRVVIRHEAVVGSARGGRSTVPLRRALLCLVAAWPIDARGELPARESGPDELLLAVAGDTVHTHAHSAVSPEFVRLGRAMYEPTRPWIEDADLAFLNLECPLTMRRRARRKGFAFPAYPSDLQHILSTGFNLISLANNHVLDAGLPGLADTLELFESTRSPVRPFWWAGAGRSRQEARRPARFEVPGKPFSVAFLAYSYGRSKHVNGRFRKRAVREVRAARDADVVIVSVHWGREYDSRPSARVVRFYRRLAAAGATVVLGHHPHVGGPVEVVGGSVVFYSLGNYAMGTATSRHLMRGATLLSILGRVALRRRDGVVFAERVELWPLWTDNLFPLEADGRYLPPTRFVPEVMGGGFADWAHDRILEWQEALPDRSARFRREGDALVWRRP